MSKFICCVQVPKPDGRYVSFVPGDQVPDWAVGIVGSHVVDSTVDFEISIENHDPENGTADVVFTESDSGSSEPAEDDADPDPGDPASEAEAEDAKPTPEPVADPVEPESQPDFTKPAPKRRGRPAKAN